MTQHILPYADTNNDTTQTALFRQTPTMTQTALPYLGRHQQWHNPHCPVQADTNNDTTHISFPQLEANSRVMRQVTGTTLYHAPSSVEVHPQEEPQEGPFEVAVDGRVVQDLQQLRDLKNGLTDGLYVAVLTLHKASNNNKSNNKL